MSSRSDAAGADAHEGRPLRDGQELGHDDLDVVGADAGGDDRDAQAAVAAGDRVELAVPALHLDVVEERRDAVGAIGIARQEDVVGHLAGREVDVVLALRVGQRDQRVRVRHGDSFSFDLARREGSAEP